MTVGRAKTRTVEAIDDATSGHVGRALALDDIKVAVSGAGNGDGHGADGKERTAAPGVTALTDWITSVPYPGPAPHRVRSKVA